MNQFQTDTPIYLQVVEEVKSQILSGQLHPGDKLESVREMASRLQVNPNTIQRAFLELEHQGFIVTQRAVGRFVSEDTDVTNDMPVVNTEPQIIKPYVNESVKQSSKLAPFFSEI